MQIVVTASSILFGFLFAGYWWSLNRELKFEPDQRHFKYGYVLLIAAMVILAIFGIILPLRIAARDDTTISSALPGIILALICVLGYMLTEYGHYRIFQKPKYTTRFEMVFFWITVIAAIITALWAWVFR